MILHITAGVYLRAEDFPYNFADLEQKFLCGGRNRLRYGCLLFLTCFSGKERGPSVSCLEASALFHFIAALLRGGFFQFPALLRFSVLKRQGIPVILELEAPADLWEASDFAPEDSDEKPKFSIPCKNPGRSAHRWGERPGKGSRQRKGARFL